jgi:hypothetical protein
MCRRRLLLGLGAVGLMGVACLIILGTRDRDDSPMHLPDASQVTSVTASLVDLRGLVGTGPVPEFTIPPKYIPTILAAFTPTKRFTEFPEQWKYPIGRLTLTTKSGQTTNVAFVDAGVNPVCFTVNGIGCMRGGRFEPLTLGLPGNAHADESLLVAGLIGEIYEQEVKGQKDEWLVRYVQQLEVSRGERPPQAW